MSKPTLTLSIRYRFRTRRALFAYLHKKGWTVLSTSPMTFYNRRAGIVSAKHMPDTVRVELSKQWEYERVRLVQRPTVEKAAS